MTLPASHPAMHATETRARRIVPCAPRPMALEARFMFDGAAAGEAAPALAEPVETVATQAPEVTLFVLPATAQDPATARPPENLPAALALAQQQVHDFIARSSAQDLFSLFNGGQVQASAEWLAAAEALSADIQEGRYSVRVELLGGTLGWAMGAFAAQGPDGNPVIYLNADWLRGETAPSDIARVLVEEIGHSIDARLNPTADTAGDEGELFAATATSMASLTQDNRTRIQQEDDHGFITVQGQVLNIEKAEYTAVNAYAVLDPVNHQVVDATSNVNDFDIDPNAPLRSAVISNEDTLTLEFSKTNNDIYAKVKIGESVYYGTISRVVKDTANSGTIGFYFWCDPNFQSFNDLKSGEKDVKGDQDNLGFFLVVDQGMVDATALASDGYKFFRSSSENVLINLNEVVVNRAPTATLDLVTVAEDSGLNTIDVLSNDSDPDGGTLSVTGFSVDGSTTSYLPGQSATIAGKGTLNLNNDGTFTFVPEANYKGAIPDVTYTIVDGQGGSATAKLSITVTPVNDRPLSDNKTVTVLEDGTYTFIASDFALTDPNDTPANALLNVIITSLPAEGTLKFDGTAVTLTSGPFIVAAADIAKLTFTPAPNANGGAYASFGFQVQDNGGTSSGGVDTSDEKTLSITVTPVNDPPTATPDSVTTDEDTPIVLTTSDFGTFSDPDTGDTLQAVRFTQFSGAGELQYQDANGFWQTVSSNQSLSIADISDGKLRFVPDLNESGSPYATAQFQVYDGTAWSTSAYNLDFIVNAVNDPPVTTNEFATVLEDTTYVLTADDFGKYSDVDFDELASVRVTGLTGQGTWEVFNSSTQIWRDLQVGDVFTKSQLTSGGALRFRPDLNESDTDYAALDFVVTDTSGATSAQRTFTMHVDPANDAPDVAPLLSQSVTSGGTLDLQDFGVSDIDGLEDTQTVTVSVDKGTLDASDVEDAVSSTDNKTVTVTGSTTVVNQRLTRLFYVAPPGETGTANVTVTTTDSGNATDTETGTIALLGRPLGSTPPPLAPDTSPPGPLQPPPTANPIVLDIMPRVHAPQVFDSTLAPLRAAATVQPTHLIEPSGAQHQPLQRAMALWTFNDAYTEAPDDGWRVVVHPDTGSLLSVLRGMPDQFIEGEGEAYVGVPWDSFFHTHSDVRVTVSASLADGTPLPSWIHLDPETGVFHMVPPQGFQGELAIRLQARDSQGREATTLFRLHVGERVPAAPRDDAAPGRSALSDQLRQAARQRQAAFAPPAPHRTATPALHPA